MDKFFIVTGCGRSGTGFLANLLAANAVNCGHESVFKPDRFDNSEFARLAADSSWFAPLWIKDLPNPENVPVLHLTRKPEDVIQSFYRMRVFAESAWPHVFSNNYDPLVIAKRVMKFGSLHQRIGYVNKIRSAIAENTEVFDQVGEVGRCVRYWVEWNSLVESVASEHGCPYLRVRIEDLEYESVLEGVAAHLSVGSLKLKGGADKNLKRNYPSRELVDLRQVQRSEYLKMEELKSRYGYGDLHVEN